VTKHLDGVLTRTRDVCALRIEAGKKEKNMWPSPHPLPLTSLRSVNRRGGRKINPHRPSLTRRPERREDFVEVVEVHNPIAVHIAGDRERKIEASRSSLRKVSPHLSLGRGRSAQPIG
jgi:hypothetical protein